MKNKLILVLSIMLCSLLMVITLQQTLASNSNLMLPQLGTAADLEIARTPETQVVIVDDPGEFTVTITNTSSFTMTGISVVDAQISDCDTTIVELIPLATTQYSCSLATVTADLTADIVASGTYTPSGMAETITGTTTTTVTILVPDIAISKTAVNDIIASGDDASFTIAITNSGDIDLELSLSDPLGDASCVSDAPAALAAGASSSHSCTSSGITTDFTNEITVTGTFTRSDLSLDSVQASDDDSVTIAQTGLIITKTLSSPFVIKGDNALFNVALQNTGNVPLTLNVENPATMDCETQAPTTISANSSTNYSCEQVSVTNAYTSVITSSGTFVSPQGTLVTASDSSSLAVPNDAPAIEVSLSPATQNVINGLDATYTVNITNTGDVDLDLTVSDPLGDANCVDNAPASLWVGASSSYSCNSSSVIADLVNDLTVTGTYTRNDNTIDTVEANDTATVIVVNPNISVSKTTTTPQVRIGEDAAFDITIENTGDVDLELSVSDPLGDANCESNAPTSLAVNSSVSYSCDSTAVTADFTNVIDVTGTYTPTSGVPYEVTDQSSIGIDVINPAISISKTPDDQIIQALGTAVFTIQVENIGDVTLTNITVGDPLAPDCNNNSIGSLAPSASTSYSCFDVNVTEDFINQATAIGTDPINRTVSASDTASVDVINPDISIEITPASQEVASGGSVDFDISVENTGDAALSNVRVDADSNQCDNFSIGTLDPGETADYSCTVNSITTAFLNNVEVTGRDPLNIERSSSSAAFVIVNDPSISITATPFQVVKRGNTAFFDITVRNDGEVTLTDVTVSNNVATPSCNRTYASLSAGASQTYRCSLGNTSAPYINVATVVATNPSSGGTVGSSAASTVEMLAVDLTFSATPDELPERGGAVIFNVIIENSGSVEVSTTSLTSPQLGNLTSGTNNNINSTTCSNGVTITSGNFMTCSFEAEVSGQPGNYSFSATAVIQDIANTTESAQDSEIVTLTDVGSSMVATLTPASGSLPEPSGTAVYTVRIENSSAADSLTLDSLSVPPFSSLNNRGNCSLPQTIAVSDSYECTFSMQISGDAGDTINRTLSASATDDDVANVSNTAVAGIFISDVSSSVEIHISPNKTTVAEPGDDVLFTITVDNTSLADEVTINSLTEGNMGSLDGQGDCNLPVTVPAGQSYSCTFSSFVSGQNGDFYTSSILLIGRDDDDVSVQAENDITIDIQERPLSVVYLPSLLSNVVAGEPNNECVVAKHLAPGLPYQFLADDVFDWYRFRLESSATVSIQFNNFVPQQGQIVIYTGNDNCTGLGTVTNNANPGLDKSIDLGVVQAGTYYILIINDGAFNFQIPYNLHILLSEPR